MYFFITTIFLSFFSYTSKTAKIKMNLTTLLSLGSRLLANNQKKLRGAEDLQKLNPVSHFFGLHGYSWEESQCISNFDIYIF